MNFLQSFQISSSGMLTQRQRMDVIASNLANVDTTHTKTGEPYRRKMVVMGTKQIETFDAILNSRVEGAHIEAVVSDHSPFREVYNPTHPDANKDGYLRKPNVDLIVEMTNMMMARKTFEANLSAIKTTRQMVLKALEIGR